MRVPANVLRILLMGLIIAGVLTAAGLDLRARITGWNPANLTDDPVSNWERRIEPLKADLPDQGEIGFLADWDLPGWNGNLSDMDNEYRLTQFALAPRLLLRGGSYTQVVANLSDPAEVEQIEALYPLRKVRDYGFGIYLFAGTAQ